MVRGKVGWRGRPGGACLLALLASAARQERRVCQHRAHPATLIVFRSSPAARGRVNTATATARRSAISTARLPRPQSSADRSTAQGVATYSYTLRAALLPPDGTAASTMLVSRPVARIAMPWALRSPRCRSRPRERTFTHPDMNGNDCAACHSRTNWQTGAAPRHRSRSARSVLVNALVPT